MIDPKEIIVDGKTFIISKFPAVAGREIIAKYPLSGMPKLGDYKINEETMLKLMGYVAVNLGNGKIALSTPALIDNHTGSWETLCKIEMAMMEYNCSFFQDGRISNFWKDFTEKLPAWILKMWTAFSQQSSRTEKLP